MQVAEEKVVRAAARKVFSPLKLLHRSESLVWMDDNGFFLTLVEFQPGSAPNSVSLNMGVSFLWNQKDYLTFDFGYREKAYIHCPDEVALYKEAAGLARYAKERVLGYRKLRVLSCARRQMFAPDFRPSGLWGDWDRAMVAILCGDCETGREYLERFFDYTPNEVWEAEWLDRYRFLISACFHDDEKLKALVLELIADRRKKLRRMRGLEKLRQDPVYG